MADEQQIKLEFLQKLVENKYIQQDQMKQIIDSLLGSDVQLKSKWTRYFSLVNFIKAVAIGLFLVAFSGIIQKLIKAMMRVILAVPAFVYQLLALAATVYCQVCPRSVSKSQWAWIAIFASFATLMVLAWVFAIYERQITPIIHKIFRLGIPPETVLNFWLLVYFAGLAVLYDSQLLGFAAVVALSSLTSFGMFYRPGTLYLDFKESKIQLVTVVHLTEILIYVGLTVSGVMPEQGKVFKAGVEYYASIAAGTALLVASSPWASRHRRAENTIYMFLFLLVSCGLVVVNLLTPVRAPGCVLFCFFFLTVLEWVGYIGFQGGLIVGCIVIGAALFGAGMLIERFGKTLGMLPK